MIWLRISGCTAAEMQVDFTEEHNIFETETQRAFLNGALLHMKIRAIINGSIQGCYSAV